MKKSQPKVLIIILNYGTYDLTLKLVQELKNNLEYKNYNIMVVDNCSPNESAKVLDNEKDKLGFLFFANDHNAGYVVQRRNLVTAGDGFATD